MSTTVDDGSPARTAADDATVTVSGLRTVSARHGRPFLTLPSGRHRLVLAPSQGTG